MKEEEDRNLELPFYEELRALYQQDRKEYKRIEKLSLRSRTGRKSRTVEGVTLSGDTMVFLKTNFRKIFYLVSDEQVRDLSSIDALNYFKALPEEPKVERIRQHHAHVERAVNEFKAIKMKEMQEEEANQRQRTNLGAQVTTAVSLLNRIIPLFAEDPDTQVKINQLKSLAERGTLTDIAKRLQRIQKDLQRPGGKAKLTVEEAKVEIKTMANKYNAYYRDTQHTEEETDADIILSESFN